MLRKYYMFFVFSFCSSLLGLINVEDQDTTKKQKEEQKKLEKSDKNSCVQSL